MSRLPLDQKYILLGVTGSIAAYKAAELASHLTQLGARVNAILTPAAVQFVTPLTFQSVTGQNAYLEDDLWGGQAHVVHVGLGHETDLMVIAPATATTMAKLANGIADNLLTLTALAFGPGNPAYPLVIAPAMDGGMFNHPATQENLETLRKRGADIVGPEAGHLASGLVALGRMSEPTAILGRIRYLLTRNGNLQGRRVVVTAGGTQEPLDPVRVLTNRSSGKQGYALAQAALDVGAQVTLISTPTALSLPVGAELVLVNTAAEMESAVLKIIQEVDVLIMAAAVADFRPMQVVAQKIKKHAGIPSFVLEPTQDILAAVAQQRTQTKSPRVVVGFAAETQDILTNAQAKLRDKCLDLMVANDVSTPGAGFGADTNRVTLLHANGQAEALPLISKVEVAERVVEEVCQLLM
jgi:phosphopantothenoylcysteine decarboxylase/phosphopantothenate--cysteine ligase